MFEQTMCSSNLQGMQAIYKSGKPEASDLSPFLNTEQGTYVCKCPLLRDLTSQLTAGKDGQIWGLTLLPIPLGL